MEPTTWAIDPGIYGSGVAIFEGPSLLWASYLPHQPGKQRRGLACRHAVLALQHCLARYPLCSHAVVEWQQQYENTAHTVNRADVTDLTGVAGAIVGLFGFYTDNISTPLPREWKGQTPKHVHMCRILGAELARARCTLPRGYKSQAPGQLSADQCRRIVWTSSKSLNHNIVDAVGLGLWAIGYS